MTTLYRPVLIETAEQAESLPIGTVSPPDHPEDLPTIKVTEQSWVCVWDVDDDHDATYDVASNGHMIGSTVLVPVEAEEERVERIKYSPRGYETAVYSETRLVTPWGPVSGPSPDRRGDCA